MGKFIYEAKNEHGQVVRGEVQAANEVVAEKLLLRNKMVVSSLEPERNALSALSFLNKISTKDRANFARQLATMIDAGLPLVQALNVILLQTKSPAFHNVLASIIRDIEGGYSFSTAMARHPQAFNRIFIAIVRSGEATGKLDEVLKELADQQEKDVAFASKIKGAMAYPIFVIGAMIAVGVLMMVMVIPTIKGVFTDAGASLPWATLALIAISDFLISFWYIAIIGIVALVIGTRMFLISKPGKLLIDKIAVKAPVISGTASAVTMARLTRTLGLLVSSGIPILESLRIVSETVNNSIYKAGLDEVREQVERGIPMSVPLLKNKNFPIVFGQMMAVGEQTGRVDGMLANLAKYYTEEADNKLKGITTLVEPVVMVILGVGVAILIFAVLVPIYNISSIG